MAQVGLKNLYYAILNSDDSNGVVYQAPVKMAEAIMAKITPKSSSSVLYADDGAAEAAVTVGETEIELETKELPLSVQAVLLGHTLAGGVMVKKTTDVSPYVAVGFESGKSSGKKRYIWLYKVKFMEMEDDYQTKQDKITFQTPKIKGVAVRREYDNSYIKMADEDDAGYTSTVGANWFNSVETNADVTAPTVVSTSPVDGNNSVAANSNIVWTFSEAIDPATVTTANFILIKSDDGTLVPGTLTQSADKLTVTFDPTSDLAVAAYPYSAIATTNVKDLSGNALAQNYVINFLTA